MNLKRFTPLLVIIAVVVGALIWISYWLGLGWTGFNASGTPGSQGYQPEKALWDWLQLLIVPAVLGFGALWFNSQQTTRDHKIAEDQRKADQERAEDQQQEIALQKFLDDLSDLLLNHGLGESEEDDTVRQVSRAKTLATLRRLNGKRNGAILRFLQEAGLREKDNPVVDLEGINLKDVALSGADLQWLNLSNLNLGGAYLEGTDLSGADLTDASLEGARLSGANLSLARLSGANLEGARLSGANLSLAHLSGANLEGAGLSGATLDRANLSGASLTRANLSEADLIEADLTGADLTGADLRGGDLYGANLEGANVSNEQLAKAKPLKNATMPDGSVHP